MDQLIAALMRGLNVNEEHATVIAEAAEPLWTALGSLGWVDGFGGAECVRVLPEALVFMYDQANAAA